MAADCHHNKQELRFLRQVDPAIWKACAGTSVQIPAAGSRVYYFPQGHIEHSSAPQSAISALSHLPPTPLVLCRVVQVLFLADPDTDEVYTRIRMEPLPNNESLRAQPPTGNSTASSVVGFRMAVMDGSYDGGDGRKEDGAVVSFAKILTPSDANNGGGFSVPRFCADSIFPPLDYAADPPVQTVTITDVRGECWSFRHIYRGTPRRHLLTTGWSKFVNSKKLIAGDSVVFMKNKNTGKLFVGVRRSVKPNSSMDVSKWALQYGALAGPAQMMRPDNGEAEARFSINGGQESVAEVLELVAKSMPFEVVYYPKAGSRDFVVAAEKVEAAMAVYWTPGMRVKIAMETEDSSRMTWFQGTVSSTSVPDYGPWQRSPWRMLQVAWDEPEALENIKRVSPWQVEVLSPAQAIDAAYPQAKRFKFPQNYGLFTNGGAEIPLPRMGLSSSMIGHLSSSQHLNYNIFPAGIQGARQDTYYISSLANTVNDGTRKVGHVSCADNNPIQKAEAVSTDLNMASSQSEIVSPDTSSSILSSSPDVAVTAAGSSASKSFQLFGQTIHADARGENPNHVNQGAGEGERLRNRLDLSLTDPCMNLLDPVPHRTAPVAEANPS